jgi:hypothetical protein
VDEGFLFYIIQPSPKGRGDKLEEEAGMNIRIKFIFWKEGPLLQSLLTRKA